MVMATATRNWTDQFRCNYEEIELNPAQEGATVLMYACQQENADQLQKILRRTPEAVRERDRTLKTVLHYCAENVSLSCAEVILNLAPDILDAADEDGYTTLHLAVIAGNTPLVNFLISKAADINALDCESHSVIHWATVCGEIELLEILLRWNANPSTPDVHGGYPIHYAAQMCGASSEMNNDSRRGLDVLRILINHDVDVNVIDHDGRQPVLWAASAGSSDAVIALINAGASVRAHDKDGLTALHCAASRGHTDCLETLIELCAADVDVIDNNGCSSLFYSVTLGHADATQLLLQCDADPNRQDRKGRTPAHCGAAKGQFETLRILKKHGGNLWIKNAKGDYCLHEAVSSGRKDLVKWLLSQRPDAVNASNSESRCPLHIAALTNNIEICKILLDYQSLVNPVMQTPKGGLLTPLDAALLKGNRGCAKYLQLHGGVPASKLTNYSAAIRGPHRIETHSDYQGSPEGKLETPHENRGSRSLDTSPSGYQTRSRKVQVRIRADLVSERVEQNVSKNLEHLKDQKHETRRESSHKNRRKQYRGNSGSYSSTSESQTDISESSSEGGHRIHRRRSHRRQYSNSRRTEYKAQSKARKCSRSRSRSYCRCSEGEKKYDDEHITSKVHFQQQSENKNTTANVQRELQSCDKGSEQTVTVLVHRQGKTDSSPKNQLDQKRNTELVNENQKSDEIKVNGTEQDTQNQKFSREVDYTEAVHEGTGQKESLAREREEKTNMSEIKADTHTDITISTFLKTGEKTHVSEVKAKPRDISTPTITNTVTNEPEGKEPTDNHTDAGTRIPENSVTDEFPVRDIKKYNLNTTHEISKPEGSLTDVDNSDSHQVLSLDPSIHITNDADVESYSNSQLERTKSSFRERNHGLGLKESENITFSNLSDTNTIPDNRKCEDNTKHTEVEKSKAALEKFKEKKLDDHFTKDKGLICVILDDDETIEIKRRKDWGKKSNEYPSRSRSANRNKEKSTEERKGRSRSSFEILTDDGNSEDPSFQLTVHDDSGFEPSPRQYEKARFEDVPNKTKSRIPRATNSYQSANWKENEPDINVTSVTQAVQNSLKKYHLERKVFHTLLELKRLQIRAGKSNEQVLVKRLVDDYQKAGLIVGLRTYDGIYSFRHFEKYLYEQLRILQSTNRKDIPRIKSSDDLERLTKALKRTRAGKTLLENVPDNPLFCTHGTHRCIHATHAYTGIPCAAYIAKLDHHKLPKPNENYRCFLPRIDNKNIQGKNPEEIAKSLKNVDPSKPVTLELIHGAEKQIISLPTKKLDKNKRYYVTLTIKGANQDKEGDNELNTDR